MSTREASAKVAEAKTAGLMPAESERYAARSARDLLRVQKHSEPTKMTRSAFVERVFFADRILLIFSPEDFRCDEHSTTECTAINFATVRNNMNTRDRF